jgi:hypothetical protein
MRTRHCSRRPTFRKCDALGIEDEVRACERDGEFESRFVELARSVYKNNDRRAALKREINELLGSVIVEEKSYEGCQ